MISPIDKTDSTALVTNLDNFIYSSDYRASRNAIEIKGLVTNAPVYPEIYGPQSSSRLMQNNTAGEEAINEKDINSTANKFSIIPNPACDYVTVTLEKINTEIVTIEFIDVRGLVLQCEKVNNLLNTINISKLPGGSYFVKIINANTISYAKLQVIK